MRFLSTGVRQSDIMISSGSVGVQREIELVFPAELEASLGESIITELRARVPLGKVCRMGRKFVCNHAFTHILTVR